jgi:transglutaminase-like putative cysteine protease
VLLLVVRTEYNRQHEEWQRRKVDYPEQLGLEWGGAAAAIVLLIVLTARAAPLFGTIEGWRAISEWVNRANQETEDTATRLFSGVNPPPPDPADDTVYASTPNLDRIGEPIPMGSKTVMWVSTSDPAPVPPGLGITIPAAPVRLHYWRSGIYASYTGSGWQEVRKSGQFVSQEEIPVSAPTGRYFLRQSFEMEARHSGSLFSVSDPIQSNNGAFLREVAPDGSRLVEGQSSKYEVISSATKVSATRLAEASPDYPGEIRMAYLQLPQDLPARVRTLSTRIAGGEPDPYHKAIKIQTYLRENFEYDLTVGEVPAGRDAVDYFLFEMSGGFCSHYASSMAVMLRAVGVPARVAAGYAMGDFDPERQAYRVPESSTHAWVEVFFPGYGWVEFEPTVGRSPIVYSEEAPTLEEPVQVTNLDDTPGLQAQPYFIALVLVGALMVLALPFVLLQMFSSSRQPAPIQVSSLYRRMRRTLSWAGLDAAGSVTPDEYLKLYNGPLEPYPVLTQALHQATALYRESVYSPRPPDDRRVRNASLLWRRSFREWFALWLRARWRNFRARWAGTEETPL